MCNQLLVFFVFRKYILPEKTLKREEVKILIFCIEGNSCRSQMAEAFLQNLDHSLEVFSACLHPDRIIDPIAVQVMNELGFDIQMKSPKSIKNFEGTHFDYLITLCSGSNEKSELIEIPAKHKIHLGFENPRKAYCTDEQLIYLYRDVRDEIKEELEYFYSSIVLPELRNSNKSGSELQNQMRQ